VVAGLATAVAEMRADILDISQTLVGEYFTMIMVIDIGATSTSFEQMRNRLLDDAKRLGIQVNVMHDDLLKAMHRV
jgi:ACT domain-containing protein